MDEGPRQRARGMALRSTTAPNESAFVAALPDRHHDQHVHHTPCTDIETVRTRLTTSGAMFSTMRMVGDEPPATDRLSLKHDELPIITSPDIRFKKQLRRQQVVYGSLPRHLPLSGIELLTSKLVATINEEGPSNQIKLFGPFIGEVPRRLGSTTALNDAAACLTTTHDAIIRKRSKIRINPQLYAKALNSLHAAIQDPLQVRSTSTLCATVLLAITEAYVSSFSRRWRFALSLTEPPRSRPLAYAAPIAISSHISAERPASWSYEVRRNSRTLPLSNEPSCEPLP